MVFYTGPGSYPYSTDIFDLFENPKLAREIFVKPFHLVEVNKIPDEVLKQKVWSGIMGLSMKHIYERDILPYLPDMLSLLRKIEDVDMEYVISTLTYLLNVSERKDDQIFFETIQHGLSPATGGKFMTIAEMLEERGMQKGVEKGRIQAKKEIAQKLLEQGLSIEVIAKAVELPESELCT